MVDEEWVRVAWSESGRRREVLRGAAHDPEWTAAARRAAAQLVQGQSAEQVGELCGIGEQEALVLLGHVRWYLP